MAIAMGRCGQRHGRPRHHPGSGHHRPPPTGLCVGDRLAAADSDCRSPMTVTAQGATRVRRAPANVWLPTQISGGNRERQAPLWPRPKYPGWNNVALVELSVHSLQQTTLLQSFADRCLTPISPQPRGNMARLTHDKHLVFFLQRGPSADGTKPPTNLGERG